MKKNKGFTLIELLAVIVVLAIIISIAVPSTITISNKIKNKMFCAKIDFIENAAKLYGEDRKSSFNSKEKTIMVKELVTTLYLKKDNLDEPYIEDPRDKSSSLDNVELTIKVDQYDRIKVQFHNNDVNDICKKE